MIKIWISASQLEGATPGRAGGVVAVIISNNGDEQFVTATQYRKLDHKRATALNLWREIRFLYPAEIHPDDYRVLYPEFNNRSNEEIRVNLISVQQRGSFE